MPSTTRIASLSPILFSFAFSGLTSSQPLPSKRWRDCNLQLSTANHQVFHAAVDPQLSLQVLAIEWSKRYITESRAVPGTNCAVDVGAVRTVPTPPASSPKCSGYAKSQCMSSGSPAALPFAIACAHVTTIHHVTAMSALDFSLPKKISALSEVIFWAVRPCSNGVSASFTSFRLGVP